MLESSQLSHLYLFANHWSATPCRGSATSGRGSATSSHESAIRNSAQYPPPTSATFRQGSPGSFPLPTDSVPVYSLSVPPPSNLCDIFPIVSSLDLPNNAPSQPNILSTTRCPLLRQTAGNGIPSSDPIDSRVSGSRTSLGNKGQPRQSLRAIKAMEVVHAVPPLRPYSTCLGCCVTYHVGLFYGDSFV